MDYQEIAETVADAIVEMQQKRADLEYQFTGKKLKFVDTKIVMQKWIQQALEYVAANKESKE